MPAQTVLSQLVIGLINGAFYALLSLGLAVIFGLLDVVSFAHGAFYTAGAFVAYLLLEHAGLGYWVSLVVAPLLVGGMGLLLERTLLRRIAGLDPLYGLLLTFGVALVVQGLLEIEYGSSGLPYPIPAALEGGVELPFMFLPRYRAWVIVFSAATCAATWYVVERTRVGALLRAGTENAALLQAFGVDVPRMRTLAFAFGVALAAVAGVLAAPIYRVNPMMGADRVIVVFAVVVIGGMGSILGSIVTGYVLGLAEAMTKIVYPAASETVVFVVMAIVLLLRPAGLFGRAE